MLQVIESPDSLFPPPSVEADSSASCLFFLKNIIIMQNTTLNTYPYPYTPVLNLRQVLSLAKPLQQRTAC